MKRGKKLIGLVVAVILGLSLILIPVASRVSPVQAAVTWTKSGEVTLKYPVTLENEKYVIDTYVIKDGSTYKMWYTHVQMDLSITDLMNGIAALNLDNLVSDIADLDLAQFLDDLGDLSGDVSDIVDLFDGVSTVIGYATSTNGKTWTVQKSQALVGMGTAWSGVGAPCVIWDATDSKYKMWYTRVKTDLTQADLQDILDDIATGSQLERKAAILDLFDSFSTVIGYATSGNGADWSVQNNQVLAGSNGVWDSVGDPCVIKYDDMYVMCYTRAKTDLDRDDLDDILDDIADIDGFGIAGLLDILDATSTIIEVVTSGDSISWGAPDEAVAGSGGIRDSVADPCLIRGSSGIEMWYTNVKTNLVEANLHTLASEIQGLDIAALWTTLKDDGLTEFVVDLLALNIDDIKSVLANTSTVIGYATVGEAGLTVQNPQHLVGSSGSPWSSVSAPSVVKSGSKYEMWYTEGIGELTVENLLGLVFGDNLPIGYAYYTPPRPPRPPEEEEEEEVIPEEEEEEEVIPEEEEEEEVIPEEEEEEEVIPEEEEEEEVIPEEEEVTSELIEELPPMEAVEILGQLPPGEAADLIEGVAPDKAGDIIVLMAPDKAADILEAVILDYAVDIIEEIAIDTAADIIEEIATDTAADIMEEVTTDTLNGLVGEMSEESLMDTLPEVSTDTLHSVDVGTLFEALPNAPTEQLTSEDPPEPPEELTDPVVRYATPGGAQYVAIRTITGEWVVVMATPEPLDKLLIKTNKALKDVETTVDILDELPSEVKVELPVGQIIMKYFNISFENAKPENIELGHLGFHVENEWLEQNSIHKWSVTLNQYDPELEQWLSLPTKKVGEDDVYIYYTAVVTHFSTFAISGSQVVSPLEFEASNLAIGSAEIPQAGEDITISADITNLSNTAGTYAVTLWIDDTVEAGENVSLEAGETTPVSFTVTRDVEGSYHVRLDRLFGSFRVIGEAKAPLAWWVWLIVGLGVVVIGGLLAYFLWWRRRIA